MNISELSIRRPVFAWMLMAGLIIFGAISFTRMGVSQLPDIDYPVVNISLSFEGAAPEVMEMDVVDLVEDAIMSVQGITGVSSSSRSGSANVTIEFELEKNIDIAVQEVQNVLAQLQRRLPKNMDPPVVRKTNPEDQPILWLTVSSDKKSEQELMTLVRDKIKDHFSRLPGVAEVFLGGYVEPTLRVWLSNEKLKRYALSASDVINAIQAEHSELPAGRIETIESETNIRTLGEATTPELFGKISINRRGGAPNFSPLALNQVAHIEDGLADVRRKSRTMGKPAVGLGVRKQRGSNAVEVARAVKAHIPAVQSLLPEGVEIGIRFDSTRFIEESVREMNFTLLLSAILTALVCWLFLGSWSATLNVILAIPTSVIGSFIVLYALRFTFNTFTLLGLSLAIGIIVDDAIMVLENIVRHREKGEDRMKAALTGSYEIRFAAMAATVAIIAIFLPIAFMKGITGKFFYQFGVTISVAVALSLLEALTLTPMRCSQFLQLGHRSTQIGRWIDAGFPRLASAYKQIITVILNHRLKVIAAALTIFIASLFLLKFIKKEFVPAQDQGLLMIRMQTPIGSSLELTDGKFKVAEEFLLKRPEVTSYFSSIGGFGGGEVNTGMIFVNLKKRRDRDVDQDAGRRPTQQDLARTYRAELQKLTGIKVFVQDLSQSGFSSRRGFPVEFTIRGPDWDKLIDLSQKMTTAMEKTGIMTDIDSDYLAGLPEIQVIPDRDKARARGVSVSDIGQTINTMMGGVVAGKYSKGGHRYDIRVRLLSAERNQAGDIKKLQVRNNRGELIPLSEVVTIREHKTLQTISRQDRERAISVFANVAPHSSQAKAIDAVNDLSRTIIPNGYRIAVSGSAKTFQESFGALIFALILGFVISYMVLASQFNSFSHPISVLMALPFSVSGAFIALLLGGQSLNIYSMIGLVLLMGIVKKNSILLIDYTNQCRARGLAVKDALTEACPIRLRPILMTSIATIAGAIPPALALGPGAESRIPMALAVIGGVIVSTALTLFVVPCVYSLLEK